MATKKKDPQITLANLIVSRVLSNLESRRGVGDELEQIEKKVRAEMVADLTSVVYDTLKEGK